MALDIKRCHTEYFYAFPYAEHCGSIAGALTKPTVFLPNKAIPAASQQ
jgi:hypothetical protein